jgi:hypothetical protein
MVNVELNKKSNNPFKGLSNCLKVLQNIEVVHNSSTFNLCWNEVKNNKEHRELFFSLMFSMGDITSRQHNIFKGIKKDSGGNANREGFYKFVEWLFTYHRDQFEKFLRTGLFNEYNCFDTLLRCRIKTTRKGTIVEQYVSLLANPSYRTMLAEYLYSVINGTNPFNKHLVAKFLTLPRLSKRSGHTKMLPETKKAMEYKTLFLIELSKLMGWDYEVQGTYANFRGYREWRKQYNQELESVLFSSKKIFDFTKDEFISWLDKLPSQARYRVRNRVLYKEQYPNQKRWFEEWEKFKEKKQEEERILTEKVRQGTASIEDKEKLEKVKKEAKVKVGAVNFKTVYEEICRGNVDALRLESFMNRVNLPYNSLVIMDDSGSMNGAPFNFATFIASVCLCKNPDDEARNLLGFFSNSTIFKSYIDSRSTQQNSLLRRTISQTIHEPLVDPTKSFLDNYKRIDSFCKSVFRGGGTRINTIAQAFANNSEVIDALKNYPIWTIISDGDWNNSYNAKESIKELFAACEKHLGFKPFIVAIDIPNGWNSIRATDWSDVDNFIYIPANIAQIEQFLTNFKDIDVFDVYTPLQSLWRSNRYELVRVNTL